MHGISTVVIMSPIIMGLEILMTMCVPIKELKDTAKFSELVSNSTEEIIVTKNGAEAFVAMSMQQLEALKLEAARAELYRLIDYAEDDIKNGRVSDYESFRQETLDKYGI